MAATRNVLMTLDLKHTPDNIRAQFYDYLEKKSWKKVPEIDTAWVKVFQLPDDSTASRDAMKIAEDEVSTLAVKAKVPSYYAVVQAGPYKPVEFNGPKLFR